MENGQLSHLDADGKASMVDVAHKADTQRTAIARGEIVMQPSTLELIEQGLMKKGDVLAVARVAGIQAAKKTSDLIPLCHLLQLHQVKLDFEIAPELPGIKIEALSKTSGKTGVEMEALTAVSVAGLTIYDMIKAVEKTAVIQNIRLVEKRGGKSGDVRYE